MQIFSVKLFICNFRKEKNIYVQNDLAYSLIDRKICLSFAKCKKQLFRRKGNKQCYHCIGWQLKGFWGNLVLLSNKCCRWAERSIYSILVNNYCQQVRRSRSLVQCYISISLLFTFANYGGIPQCTVGLVLYLQIPKFYHYIYTQEVRISLVMIWSEYVIDK